MAVLRTNEPIESRDVPETELTEIRGNMTAETLHVLLIEDSEDDAILLKRELEKSGTKLTIQRVETEDGVRKALMKSKFDVVISDYILPKFSGLDALKITREFLPDVPFLLVSGKIGEEVAVEAIRQGANDYIMKGNLIRLNLAVKRELEEAENRKERNLAREELGRSYEELKESALRLEEANRSILEEAAERKKAQLEAIEAKEYLKNLIDSASEIVISFDKGMKVTTWNRTAQALTGYTEKEVLNRGLEKLSVFADAKEMTAIIKGVHPQSRSRNDEFTLKTKTNAKKIIRASGSVLRGSNNETLGVLYVGRDITPEIEAHGKLIDGMSYLIRERESAPSVDLFSNLVRSGYNGLLVTRSNPEIVKSMVPNLPEIEILPLHNDLKDPRKQIGVDQLAETIEKFTLGKKNTVVLLDGFHFMLSKFTFNGFLEGLFRISDTIAQNKAILLVRIDPSLLDVQEMAVVENELTLLPSQKIEDIIIGDEIHDLLRFIYEQNQNNALVSIKKIMTKFQISYVTTAKRIESLETDGLLYVKKQGKLRTPYITDKGKALLHKRRSA
jgi:PAS domain S-box-containing protein